MDKKFDIIETIGDEVIGEIARSLNESRTKIIRDLRAVFETQLSQNEPVMSKPDLKKFWVGWEEPESRRGKRTNSSRKMSWVFGERLDGARLMGSMVWALDREMATLTVAYSYQGMPDPSEFTWRFVDEKEPDWLPGDRCPDAEGREKEYAEAAGVAARADQRKSGNRARNPFPEGCRAYAHWSIGFFSGEDHI